MVNIPKEGVITGIEIKGEIKKEEDWFVLYAKVPKVALPQPLKRLFECTPYFGSVPSFEADDCYYYFLRRNKNYEEIFEDGGKLLDSFVWALNKCKNYLLKE